MTDLMPGLHLEHLAPVDLDELNSHAALLSRVDRKYVLSHAAHVGLLAALGDNCRVLEVDGSRAFRYESIYFDTSNHESYLRAAHGRRRRFKVRTRRYADSSACWLEVKTRGSRSSTVKERIPCDASAHGNLTRDGRAFVAERLQSAAIDSVVAGELHPVLGVGYVRSTLLLPAEGSRVTIDLDVAAWPIGSEPCTLAEAVIVETKSAGGPSSVDRLLWSLGVRPSTISKFGVGMAAHHPHLSATKWHRVMNRTVNSRSKDSS